MVKFNNNSEPISNDIEKYIISIINKSPPLSYDYITDDELLVIINKVNKKFNSFLITDYNKKIILSIRSSFMKNYMIINYKNIFKNSKNIINDYNNNINIIDLCTKYDISPLNILRYIFDNKYNVKLTKIIKNKNNNNIDKYDLKQLELAIKHDAFALIDQTEIHKNSLDFEKQIQKFLINNNIKFKTQDQLTIEQIKLYGKAVNTPDFLIKSDLFIDNFKINWIDAKNFYGADIKFIKKSIDKQIQKYINNYGSGAIIFSLSFNDKLHFDNIVLLDKNIYI